MQIPFSSQYFSHIHAQKAHVLPVFAMHFWYGMTVYVYPNAQSVMVFCIGFTISYTRRKKNRLYMHVLKSYAHIGSVLSSFQRRLSSQISYFNANCMPLGLSTCTYNDIASLHAQNTEHENASQAFVVQCCATSAVKLSVLTTQFKWSIILAREAIISCKWF